MSIPENMKQITEAAEKLIATADVQGSFILSEEQLKKQGQRIIFQNDAPDKTELVLGDEFEVKVENGKTFVVRKQPPYPKTFENCLKILGYNIAHTIPMNHGHNGSLMMKFQRLLICRDAYWKIAGNEIGLGKPWEPDYNEESYEQGSPIKYVIYYTGTHITKEQKCTPSYILAFPTPEMRDAFYENFKDLIEECKELL